MRSRPMMIAGAAFLFGLAGCADGSNGSDSSVPGLGVEKPARSPSRSSPDTGVGIAEPGQGSGEPADSPAEKIVIRGGRATARVDVSSGVPNLVLGGLRYQLVHEDGSFDRQSAERLFAALGAAGEFLEIELIMPPEVPGKVVEQMVFFMEEKGKVPIVSSPGTATGDQARE